MVRLARVVVPGEPHHVIQRGNRRQQTFFRKSDYQYYLDLALEWTQAFGVQIWACCLMSNHVHLIAVPSTEKSLAEATVKFIDAIPVRSISGRTGEVICGRGDSSHTRWMSSIFSRQQDTLSRTQLPQVWSICLISINGAVLVITSVFHQTLF